MQERKELMTLFISMWFLHIDSKVQRAAGMILLFLGTFLFQLNSGASSWSQKS